jgi:hypothetical protein
MPDLFNTFGLLTQYRQDYTTRQLHEVAAVIGAGQSFHRVLINDERQRELTSTFKSGVEWDRERLSALVIKAQQLQGRLQIIYQAMLDRTLHANSQDEATAGELTDDWAQDSWRIAGADLPLNYSRAAMPRPDGSDRFARSSDTLGRLHFYTTGTEDTRYEERAGYFTTVSYLYDWDLHQIHTSYATGHDPGGDLSDVSQVRRVEVLAVDPNRQPARQWQAGDLIPLDVSEIFTPEFLSSGMGQHLAGIRYVNGSGYQFDANVPLYAYVREVDQLPDGVTKPRVIDILAGPSLTDADDDEIPDNVVMLDDYLRGISSQSADMTLRSDLNMGTTEVNGWIPDSGQVYHFNDAPFIGPNGGVGFDHSVWAGTHWQGSSILGGLGFGGGQWDDDHADFTKAMGMPDIPLMHPTLDYTLPWTVRIDDFGKLEWSNGATWRTLAGDSVAGSAVDANPDLTIKSMDLLPGQLNFHIEGYNRKMQAWATLIPPGTGIAAEMADGSWTHEDRIAAWWRDGAAGLEIDNGNLTVKTLKRESAPGLNDGDQNLKGAARFYVDPKGNIFDLYGQGNDSPDDYDYIPDVEENQRLNRVGNIFGSRQHLAAVRPLDPNGDGRLDGEETIPLVQISARNFNQPDTPLTVPTVGSGDAYDAVAADPDTITLGTFNPGLAGLYLGFAEKPDLTMGTAAVDKDAYGKLLNRLTILPRRTGDSLSVPDSPTSGSAMLDRDYQALSDGATVVIRDGLGRIIDSGATVGPQLPDGSYTVTPSAGIQLRSGTAYTVTLPHDPKARSGGSRQNGLTHLLADILTTSEYREVLKAGLLDDIMLSASATDPYGGMLSGKLTIRWNKRQERMELYQNSFAAVAKLPAPPPDTRR